MTQTICRMYDRPERAQEAATALRTYRRMRFQDVTVYDRKCGSGSGSIEAITAALLKGYVLKAEAKVYAERIQLGGVLVVVHAPFGCGGLAVKLLDRHGPVPSGTEVEPERPMAWDEAAPMSSLLHFRTSLPDDASFSRFWSMPLLAERTASLSWALRLPLLSDQRGGYKSFLGLPLLSRKASPLSSMLGLPLLSSGSNRR